MGIRAMDEVWRRSPYDGQMLLLHLSLAEFVSIGGYSEKYKRIGFGKTTLRILQYKARFRGREALIEALDLLDEDGHLDYDITSPEDYLADDETIGENDNEQFISFKLYLDGLLPDEHQHLQDLYLALHKKHDLLIEEMNQLKDSLSSPEITGYVYIVRAGQYFKIGRTKDITNRLTQLAIQLPEKPILLHTISTSNPIAAEQYFHDRFSLRRLNGEWFALSDDDIDALQSINEWHPTQLAKR